MAHAGIGRSRGARLCSVGLLFASSLVASLPPARAAAADLPEGSPAHTDAAQLAERYIAAFVVRQRLKAENAFLAGELARIEAASRSGSRARALLEQLQWITPGMRQELVGMLQENSGPLVENLTESARQLHQQVQQLQAQWQTMRTSINAQRCLLFEVKGSRRVAGQLAWLLSVDNRWFWLCGVVAVAGLVAVLFHDRRHEIRRLLSGGRARALKLSQFLTAALLILVVITAATFVMGDRIYQSLLQVGAGGEAFPHDAITAEIAPLEEEVAALRSRHQQLAGQHDRAQGAWRQVLADSLPPDASLPGQWQAFRAGLLEITGELALLEGLPRAMAADRSTLEELGEELGTAAEATARLSQMKQWIRGLLGVALLALAGGGGVLFWCGSQQRRQATASTCPLCLGRNKLEVLGEGLSQSLRHGRGTVPFSDRRVASLPENRDSPLRPGRTPVRCRNVISRKPYEECGYTFLSAYRAMDKLCFPTLGIPQAGKTHWLAMLYWALNRGDYPRRVKFERLRSRSSHDFDMIVEEILNARIGTAATQRERVPHPLVFNFRDHDRLGRSHVLVNIFDYSGEVTADMGVEDYRRRRALDAHGFFFFLDPTFPSEPQAKALADFREDLRQIKGIKAGRRTRVPVALCVSKIDVLAAQSCALPDGGDAVQRFYQELSEIDPTGEALTPQVLRARSRAIARLRDLIWPDWQIEQQIDDLFGGRYLFFPLTPVGLEGRGETDLSLRTISPFGLLEPLVWLLQMNGYPILE